MVTAVSFVLLGACIVGIVWTAVSLHRNPPVLWEATWLTKSELGQFEERLSGLREVILLADAIDIPSHDNARDILFALLDNFSEGVTYNFIVPEFYAEQHGEEVQCRYHAIIDLAGRLSGRHLPHTLFRLIARSPASKEDDFPYLFYRFTGRSTESEVVAFRGEDLGTGIAENYRRLEPELGRSLLFSALPYLATASQAVQAADYSIFTPESRIIPFKPLNKGLRQHGTEGSIPRIGS